MTDSPVASPEVPAEGWRTFVIVWATQSFSLLGTAMTFFAVNIWLTQVLYPRPEQKPALALALSATSLAFALPTVFLAPLAGAWADRHDRLRTMLVMNLVAGSLSLTLAALLLAHALTLPLLLPLLALYCALGAFHAASFDSSYAMLVTPAQLPRANGMMQTIWALSGVLSPAMAAALISLPALARHGGWGGTMGAWLAGMSSGVPFAVMADGATFYAAGVALLFLHIPSPRRDDLHTFDGKRKSIWADVRQGAEFIWVRRPLLWLLGTFAVVNLLGSPVVVLQPLVLKFNLAADMKARGFSYESALALLNGLNSVGGIAGGIAISVWGGLQTGRVRGVLIPLALEGVLMVFYGRSARVLVSGAVLVMMGAMLPAINAHSQAIWQTQVPRELQGRVFSVRRLIAQFTFPLGAGLAGVMGGLLDPGIAIAWLGVACAVFGVIQLFNPMLKHVEDKAWLDAMAEHASAGR